MEKLTRHTSFSPHVAERSTVLVLLPSIGDSQMPVFLSCNENGFRALGSRPHNEEPSPSGFVVSTCLPW